MRILSITWPATGSASYGTVNIVVDGPHPEVTGVTASPDNGVLQSGDNITVTVTMSSAVTVDQTDAPLFLETNDGWIELQSGSGTDTLVFSGPLGAYDPGQPVTITGDDNDDYDAHVSDTLSGSLADLSGAHVTFQELSVACYCRGTLIGAEGGEIAVEDLAIGDRVMTQSGPRAIKWIGRRSYTGRFVMGRKDILPICFKVGSLDDNVPSRDLWISPHHAMFLEGVLIEANDLVNGVSVVQAESVNEVEYFHIELETHDVIFAEGAPSESFVDDGSRAMFHNAHLYRDMSGASLQRRSRAIARRVLSRATRSRECGNVLLRAPVCCGLPMRVRGGYAVSSISSVPTASRAGRRTWITRTRRSVSTLLRTTN